MKKKALTEGEQINEITNALERDIKAIAKKYHLITAAIVASSAADNSEGAMWHSVVAGDSSNVEVLLAWALGKATVRRQEHVRRLMMAGAVVGKF